MSDHTFNINRFGKLLREDFLLNKRQYFFAALILAAFPILSYLASGYWNPSVHESNRFESLPGLMLFGLIFTFLRLNLFSDPRKSQFFLGLPASTLEKYSAKWLITGPLFFLGFVSTLFVGAVIGKFLAQALFSYNTPGMTAFFSALPDIFAAYMMVHIIFMIGMIQWKRYAPLKMAGMGIGVLIAFTMIVAILARVIFHEYAEGWGVQMSDSDFSFQGDPEEIFNTPFVNTLKYLLILAGPICFWLSGYFKLKEKEI